MSGLTGVITVRPATGADAATIVKYVRALAEFEKEPPDRVQLDEQAVLKHGFGDRAYFEVLIAEYEDAPAGMALFFHNYSTWEARPGIYLEDIYVEEHLRGTGIGRELMRALAGLAVARDCARIDLAALHWNPAQRFYGKLGFEKMDEWETYRLDGPALARLAEGP